MESKKVELSFKLGAEEPLDKQIQTENVDAVEEVTFLNRAQRAQADARDDADFDRRHAVREAEEEDVKEEDEPTKK